VIHVNKKSLAVPVPVPVVVENLAYSKAFDFGFKSLVV
jgi:hypothetical protein